MDPLAARVQARQVLDGVLRGDIQSGGALRRAWPAGSGDLLLRRAFHEAQHYLATRGELERRIVHLLGQFLERGGTPRELEDAYDAVIRAFHAGEHGSG